MKEIELTNSEKTVIVVKCERIRKAIERADFRFYETCARITISVGFHIIKVGSVAIEKVLHEMIRKADEALYLAKDRGKNRAESIL